MKVNIWLCLLIVMAWVLILMTDSSAQPSLPSAPNQAPIDGGLGILAAAGGSYALHKLRKTKKQKEGELL